MTVPSMSKEKFTRHGVVLRIQPERFQVADACALMACQLAHNRRGRPGR